MSDKPIRPATEPQPVEDVQGDGRWMAQHTRFVQECKDAEPDVLFVGDSMVQLMLQHDIWREMFSPLHALNFGIGGDTTCNVLWRLQNGELDNIKPKVVVLWVGTNNHQHTAEQVAEGILAVAQLLTSRLPKAKVIILVRSQTKTHPHIHRLGLLPRGERPNPLREKNSAVNGLLRSRLPRPGQVLLLDAGPGLLQPDGSLSQRDMFDFLHLTAAGYAAVAKPLSELLLQILEETPEERRASLGSRPLGWSAGRPAPGVSLTAGAWEEEQEERRSRRVEVEEVCRRGVWGLVYRERLELNLAKLIWIKYITFFS
ncbi:Platelet-activating factor acetylhydrolase IB subunit beta [Merluccius polli]|uniref:Platelet-activating factor acetylhydrolase IB subunit alpha2 n=1 Tax=Merluccius polli TaxID=89951 RepID=A0AA47MG01_MERPO|nr:Platelet-activating factor acetylhydrolase IB subunit beta [Merluccius polli]